MERRCTKMDKGMQMCKQCWLTERRCPERMAHMPPTCHPHAKGAHVHLQQCPTHSLRLVDLLVVNISCQYLSLYYCNAPKRFILLWLSITGYHFPHICLPDWPPISLRVLPVPYVEDPLNHTFNAHPHVNECVPLHPDQHCHTIFSTQRLCVKVVV